ncbi:MAG: glycosyltransferase family 4 protein [Bacteroidales bacterium]|nr:glycosyltransferase family 4 protein [Bacteroidales bacterium]
MEGANRSMLQLMKELRQNHGITPVVVCPKATPTHSLTEVCKNMAQGGVECHTLPMAWFQNNFDNYPKVKSMLYRIASVFLPYYAIFKLRKVKFDLVHSNGSVIDTGAYLAWARRVPHVWHLREFGYEDFGLKPILGQWYAKWIYRKCSHAIAISKAIEAKFKPYFHDKVSTIYNGIDEKDDSLLATHDSEVTTFCIAGRIKPSKGQMGVAKACALLKTLTSKPFKMLVVGAGLPEYVTELKQFIAEHQLQDHITITGYRDDVPQLLKQCDVGIMASSNEAFGRVTVEYMMQNLAVIASRAGANPEIVTHGETGLLYTLGDTEQLAHHMKRLIDDRPFLQALAQRGHTHARQHFSSVKNSDSIAALYHQLLTKRK